MRDRIHKELSEHPDLDDETVAKQVVDSCKTRADLTEAVMPLVVAEVANVRRNETRAIERRMFQGASDSTTTPSEQRLELLDRTFPVHDGRFVRWGEATIADHEARIEYLQKLASGIEQTIDIHRSVVARLEDAGVDSLGELDDISFLKELT